jgi:hypothetical protein
MELVLSAGQDFFPLDEELGLLPGSLTPRQQEHLVHLSSWMPFERAAKMLEMLVGVQISAATARRQTETAGAYAQAVQTAQAKEQKTPSGKAVTRLAVSADGAYVPLLKGEWAEVRTVAIGEVEQDATTTRQAEVHTRHLSYFSRMIDAERFADLAEVEMRRRAVSQAKAVCAVTDGADWLQGFIDLHRPDALRILDFPHAAEHLALLIEALHQAGVTLPANALERSLHLLKHRGPALLLRWCDHLPGPITELEAVYKQLNYFRKRVGLMQYPLYRKLGWPIGSGMVESANKVVVEARLKGAGMHWEPTHVNPMLALRTAVCNERWLETWQEVMTEQRHQRNRQRQCQAATRLRPLISSLMLLFLQFHPPAPKPAPPAPRPVAPAATLPGSSRPSAYHPWKQGRACRPKIRAKK